MSKCISGVWFPWLAYLHIAIVPGLLKLHCGAKVMGNLRFYTSHKRPWKISLSCAINVRSEGPAGCDWTRCNLMCMSTGQRVPGLGYWLHGYWRPSCYDQWLRWWEGAYAVNYLAGPSWSRCTLNLPICGTTWYPVMDMELCGLTEIRLGKCWPQGFRRR